MTYLDSLQTTLAAEHAAVFVLGYLGAQTSASRQPQLYDTLTRAYEEHRARRDRLIVRVRDAGGDPAPAEPSYRLPAVGGDPARIARRALRLERETGEVYGFLVASSPSPQRRFPIDALVDCALRELELGGEPRRYPGR